MRNELAHTLYQHDAACRVIAKLIQERDAAVAAVNDPARRAAAGGGDAMDTDEGIPESVKERMTERSAELSKGRKKRPVSEGLAGEAALQGFKESVKFAAHKGQAATCVAVHPQDGNLVLSGDSAGAAVVSNRKSKKGVVPIVGHKAAITRAIFHPTQGTILTASKDTTVKVWSDKGKQLHSFDMHKGEVSGVSVHATGDFFVSTATDKSWAFCDIAQGKVLQLVRGDIPAGFTASMSHPDGLILGTGTADGMVRIWDIKSQQNVVSFAAHGGAVGSLCFSENGYYCATTGADGAKVWDLRKVAKMGANAQAATHMPGAAADAVFDFSGSYLCVAGQEGAKVVLAKSWAEVAVFPAAGAAGVAFGPDALCLAAACDDGVVRVYA